MNKTNVFWIGYCIWLAVHTYLRLSGYAFYPYGAISTVVAFILMLFWLSWELNEIIYNDGEEEQQDADIHS